MLFILAGALLPMMATSQVCGCNPNYYFKSADDTCDGCDSTAIAGTAASTTHVSCTAATAGTKMLVVTATGAEATPHTGCAADYFYTVQTGTTNGKCEACDGTAITGVANKASTTHVSCTATTAGTKMLVVTATGDEATTHTGCASGYFYTPQTGTTNGLCEACDGTAITGVANKASTTHVSCTDTTAGTKVLAETGTDWEAAPYTGCASGYIYIFQTGTTNGKCEACDGTAITGVANKASTTHVSCTDTTAGTKMLVVTATGWEALPQSGCASGYFYETQTGTTDGKCEACDGTAITGVANKASTTHVSCSATTAGTKMLVVTATGAQATATTGCASGYFYTPQTGTTDGKCEACSATTLSNLAGDITCTSAQSPLALTCRAVRPSATSSAHNAVLSLSAAALVVMASQF